MRACLCVYVPVQAHRHVHTHAHVHTHTHTHTHTHILVCWGTDTQNIHRKHRVCRIFYIRWKPAGNVNWQELT